MASVLQQIAGTAAGGIAVVSAAAAIGEFTQSSRSTHWSFYVLTAGACVSCIVAIAGVVLANYPLIAICALATATNILGAFFIKRLSIYKDLDSKIERLTSVGDQIDRQTSSLKADNAQLQAQIRPLEEVAGKLKALIEQRKAALVAQEGQLDRLERAGADLSAGAGATVESQVQASKALLEEFDRLVAERNALSQQVSQLTHGAQTVDRVNIELDDDRADLHRIIEQLTSQNQQLRATLAELQSRGESAGAAAAAGASQVDHEAGSTTRALDQATQEDVAAMGRVGVTLDLAASQISQAEQAMRALAMLGEFAKQVSPPHRRASLRRAAAAQAVDGAAATASAARAATRAAPSPLHAPPSELLAASQLPPSPRSDDARSAGSLSPVSSPTSAASLAAGESLAAPASAQTSDRDSLIAALEAHGGSSGSAPLARPLVSIASMDAARRALLATHAAASQVPLGAAQLPAGAL